MKRLILALCVVLACTQDGTPPETTTDPGPPGGPPTPPSSTGSCDAGNGGITLPAGFCATIFADRVGTARHLAVSASGDLYVNIAGGALLALRDTNRDGRADVTARFGRSGNSGLALLGSDLFVDVQGGFIVRYRLTSGALAPAGNPDTIVRALPVGGHGTRSIAVNRNGELFVNVGSASNNCEAVVRDPCAELTTRAGIWRFDAQRINQSFAATNRFATGIRNAVALTTHPTTNTVFALQHGRDNLQNFRQLFSNEDAAENPAEELFEVNAGDDFGWPYCYHDERAQRHVLAPEYGGNRSTVGRCAATKAATTTFPGHWAPNGIVFYQASLFPARYRGGAFVAFHGSWNRAPLPQRGYLIAFVPAAGNSLATSYEIFADGFAGTANLTDPAAAAFRPTGLAIDPAGALFIGDDKTGRIWRVTPR